MNFVNIPGKDFEMMDAPFTNEEWMHWMKKVPSYNKEPNNPVETVSYNDIQKLLKKMNVMKDGYVYRLPTEEEWEFCAKSCDDQKLNDIAWYCENSELRSHPVKEKLPNALGLYDMLGNIWELTDCQYNKDGSYPAIRGGGWSSGAYYIRSAQRSHVGPDYVDYGVGFRLARTKSLPSNTFTLSESEAAKRAEALKEVRKIIAKLSKLERLLK